MHFYGRIMILHKYKIEQAVGGVDGRRGVLPSGHMTIRPYGE